MQIEVAVSKTAKYAQSRSGDSIEVVERAKGGLTAIMADGQGSGKAAKLISNLVVTKAAALIGDGTRDGAVARAAHDFLFALRDGKVSATLTLISADLASQSIVISRNSNCPVLVRKGDKVEVLDDPVEPIGFHHFMKPVIHEIPMARDTVILTFTDGILYAGRNHGKQLEMDEIIRELLSFSAAECTELADRVLCLSLEKDKGRAVDDMTVLVMGIYGEEKSTVGKLRVVYPV